MRWAIATSLVLIVGAQALLAQEYEDPEAGIDMRFGLGMYLGGERTSGEIRPQESLDQPISDPQSLLIGIALRFKAAFFLLRVGAEGGLPLFGGKGNLTNSTAAEEYRLTTLHTPITAGLNFAIGRRSAVHIGMGPSFYQLNLDIKGDQHSASYSTKASGLHFLIGAEMGLSEAGVFSLEWMHTSGISGTVGGDGTRDRVIGLANDKILLGYTYYFFF